MRLVCMLVVVATMLVAIATPLYVPTANNSQTQAMPRTALATIPPPQTEWNKLYGGTSSDWAYSVQQTSDGGYIIAGTTYSFGAGLQDMWLVKTDSSGKQQWNKTYGGTDYDWAYSVQQTSDGGYIIGGATYSFGAGQDDFWLVKTDSSGEQQWNKTYGGSGYELAYSVRQTSDAGYVIAGTADFSGAGGGDFWLVKTDSSGKQQWNKTYGGTDYDRAHSVQQTPDGGYIMAGTTDSFGAGGGDFWLVKTDSSGKQQWSKTCGGTADDWVYSAQQTSDGGYMIAGSTKSFGAGGADFWLVKTDSSGNQQWNKTYGGTIDEWAYSVRQTSEGGYIIAGIAHYDAGSGDFWLVKTDPSGNQQWGKTYGGSGYESAESVQETSDGGYVIAGATNSFGAGQNEFWLVKTGDATPPSTISDLSAGSPTSDSIVLTWTAPGDNWMRGNATGYMVKYSTSGPITDANWNSATTYPQSWTPARNCTMETHMVSGLTSATEYWFAVQAHDDLNLYGGVSNSPSATTATTTPLTIIMGGVGVAIAAIVIMVAMLVKRKKPS